MAFCASATHRAVGALQRTVFSTTRRGFRASTPSGEQLFNAERVRQYERMNKVPDKESALKELEDLGKPGGQSVVEFYFGEHNSASVIAAVNTIKHPAVADDELLLYAARKNTRTRLATGLAWVPGMYGGVQTYLNLADFGLPVPWWQIGLAFGATGLMFIGSWRALAGEVAALVLTNGGTHVRVHPFNLLAGPKDQGVTVPVRLIRGVTGSAGIGKVVGGGAAGRTAGSPLTPQRYSELDAATAEEEAPAEDTPAPLKGDASHELVPVLGQGNGTTAYATPRFFAVAPPDAGETVAAGILGKQMVLDFRNGISNIFSYHDTLLEQVMQGKPASIPAWRAAVEGISTMANPAVAATSGSAVNDAAAAAPAAEAAAYWKEATDEQGRVYFYNEITRESRWELPADAKQA